MKRIKFYYNLMKTGSKKAQLNTKTKKMRFTTRSILYFPWVSGYWKFILEHEFLSKTIYDYPIMSSKLLRPYLTSKTKIKDKLNIIKDSYQFIDNNFPTSTKNKLYKEKSIILTTINGNKDSLFNIRFSIFTRFDKEGEFSLTLETEEKTTLAILTFSIKLEKNGKYKVIIGGLQGARKETEHSLIKEATKNLHGLFPKKIVLESLYSLEQFLSVKFTKEAVGNELHVYNSLRYRKKRTINSSYDQFWNTQNAKKLTNNLWALPDKIKRKPIEEVPSKKRSQYRKKYALLDSLTQEFAL